MFILNIIIALLSIFLAILFSFIYSIKELVNLNIRYQENSENFNLISDVNKASTIIFSRTLNHPFTREAALKLSEQGFHVLAGCNSDLEVNSLAYESLQKGFEPLVFEFDNPVHVSKVIYRSLEIKRDNNRSYNSLVINLAGNI